MIDMPPPTVSDLKDAAHQTFDVFAEALGTGKGGKVIIGPTHRQGSKRWAFVRIDGDHPYRFKLVVSLIPDINDDGVDDFSAYIVPADKP